MSLVLDTFHRDAIGTHLERAYPDEGCGVLVGRDGPKRMVEQVRPVNNRSTRGRRGHYLIDPEDFLAIEKEARDEGLDVIGFFHSHPDDDPEPSKVDHAEALPHYSYLIAGVRQGTMTELRSWRVQGAGSLAAEPLEVVAADLGGRRSEE